MVTFTINDLIIDTFNGHITLHLAHALVKFRNPSLKHVIIIAQLTHVLLTISSSYLPKPRRQQSLPLKVLYNRHRKNTAHVSCFQRNGKATQDW